MSLLEPQTVREQIVASYANLSLAHYMLDHSMGSYEPKCWRFRQWKYTKLISDEESFRSLYDDEKDKARKENVGICSYCGSGESFHQDHLIPRLVGGLDEGNLVYSCGSCNSSKGAKDLLVWLKAKGKLPSILLWRRYLKLVRRYCSENGYMDESFPADFPEMPFDLYLLPLNDIPHTLIKFSSCCEKPA